MVPNFYELQRLTQIRDFNVNAAFGIALILLLGWALMRQARPWLRMTYSALLVSLHLSMSFMMFMLKVLP